MVTLGWWNDFLSVQLCQPCPPYGLQWAGLRFPGQGGKRQGQAVVKELVHSHQWPLHSGHPSKASIDVFFLPVVFQSRKEPPIATGSSALRVRAARRGGTEGELVESLAQTALCGQLLLCLSVPASCIAKSSLVTFCVSCSTHFLRCFWTLSARSF